MIDINCFNSMRELLDYKRNFVSNSNEMLEEVNKLIYEIKNVVKTNKEWLDILLGIINKREDKYHIEYLSGIKENVEWNAVLFVENSVNINEIALMETSGIIYFAPDLFYEYYQDKKIVLYEAYYFNKSNYLELEKNLSKLLKNGIINGLYESELEQIYELLFREYKKNNIEKRSSSYVRIKQI